ncbi:restriction endonuclease subunit S [Pirellulimonas nuda]|nr:restriction endonuclease subunit S [Pirellulimonas nuda]
MTLQQTEAGQIPNDWCVRPLKNILALCMDYRGRTPKKLGMEWGGGEILALSANNVQMGTIDRTKEAYFGSVPLYERWMSRGDCEVGDVLITTEAPLGNVTQIPDSSRYILSQRVVLLRPCSFIAKDYLAYYMAGERFQSSLSRCASGTTAKGIQRTQLELLQVAYPPTLAEQEAIAEALSDADAWIESLEALVAKKRAVKQAVMQQLLTGRTRLPGFEGEWETKRLSQLGATYGGLTGKTKGHFGDGNARYIPFMNIMENVIIDPEDLGLVDVEANESQNQVASGDLFFNGSSETPEEVGMCSFLEEELSNTYVNSFCFGFRLHPSIEEDGRFLAYYLRSSAGRELMRSLAQGATRYNLSKKSLVALELRLPQPLEQRAIVTVLSDMDAEVSVITTKLAKSRQIKQGMMQELLTGKTRLV